MRPPRSRVDSVVARASAEWHAERQALTAKVEDIEQWASSRVGTVVALEEEVGVGVGSVDGHDSSCRHKGTSMVSAPTIVCSLGVRAPDMAISSVERARCWCGWLS